MDQEPSSDDAFQLVRIAQPGAWGFKIACSKRVVLPDSAIAAGTRFDACTLLRQIRAAEGWGEHVAAKTEDFTGGFWQHFVPSLPTTPTISTRIDPIWGSVQDHTFLDLITNTRPDVADDFDIGADTVITTGGDSVVTTGGDSVVTTGARVVLDAVETDLGQGLCNVVITTVDNAEVQTTETVLDDESGTMLDITRIHTLATTAPAASGLDAGTGLFTEVAPVEHHHWLSTRRKASGLPASHALALAFDTTGAIRWPAVLEAWAFKVQRTGSNWTETISKNLREAYADEVKVTVRRWFQYTAPTITMPTPMIGASIDVSGRELNFVIEPCLHAAFEAEEYNQITRDAPANGAIIDSVPFGYEVQAQTLVWTFPATPLTDWPESVVKTQVEFTRGGFLCEERTYHRPDIYTAPLVMSQRVPTGFEIATVT